MIYNLKITGEDVLGVLPFNNTVDQVKLTGKAIRWKISLFYSHFIIGVLLPCPRNSSQTPGAFWNTTLRPCAQTRPVSLSSSCKWDILHHDGGSEYIAQIHDIRKREVSTFLDLFILCPQVAGLKVDFHIRKWNSGSRIAKIDLINEDGWVVWFPQFSSYRVFNLPITWRRYCLWFGTCIL